MAFEGDRYEQIDISLISEKDKEELKASAASIISGTTAISTSDSSSFTPGKSLFINTRGIPCLRLPFPPSELEIGIYGADGSLAYLSTREKRSSGSCILSDSSKNNVISTKYTWGPGRDPVLRLLGPTAGEIKTVSKYTSRSHKFVMPNGEIFEWTYKRERGADGKKATLLVLIGKDGSGAEGRRIAQLVRNEETRTPGSKKSSAGNGGELVLGQGAEGTIDKPVVVATCLLMLKKEIDRRRAFHAMVLSAAISGGGA
ncbi:hypothetical protein K432DRAFT_385170 [Lepidopterella palustris CBS 459.81]|uniref:Uncharacterized protein n=1 Tax=Lepidopterella palustris CBS 459.81 TaxID=1314670 RepID=A0A8E2JBS1_9PEZI|nr:hypothetical protein K432DRAFT_385170 [Lepidopterella palustris CBS 459.81]